MGHYTRFRAYQLGCCGASFSLSVNKYFALIEARYNEVNAPHIQWEMNMQGIDHINLLHITSWDSDHCQHSELANILHYLRPERIEYPSYEPHTDNGVRAKGLIQKYSREKKAISSRYVQEQEKRPLYGQDLFYNPTSISCNSNDNSVVKLFRVGSFQILSLGDCESNAIRDALMNDDILQKEVDVMILAHHGANNDFTTPEFLRQIKPRVAICASDYGNKYGHPDSVIVSRLKNAGVKYFSTKTGDVVAQTVNKYKFKVSNYIANNTQRGEVLEFENKTWYTVD